MDKKLLQRRLGWIAIGVGVLTLFLALSGFVFGRWFRSAQMDYGYYAPMMQQQPPMMQQQPPMMQQHDHRGYERGGYEHGGYDRGGPPMAVPPPMAQQQPPMMQQQPCGGTMAMPHAQSYGGMGMMTGARGDRMPGPSPFLFLGCLVIVGLLTLGAGMVGWYFGRKHQKKSDDETPPSTPANDGTSDPPPPTPSGSGAYTGETQML